MIIITINFCARCVSLKNGSFHSSTYSNIINTNTASTTATKLASTNNHQQPNNITAETQYDGALLPPISHHHHDNHCQIISEEASAQLTS